MITIALAATLAFSTPADNTVEASAQPLAEGQCLRTDAAVDWHDLDDYNLLVRSLDRRFLLSLSGPCESMHSAPTIELQGAGMNRVCGRLGEYIRVRGARCRIQHVTPLDKPEYDDYLAHRKKPDWPPRKT